MNTHLLVHNIGFLAGGIINIGIVCFVLYTARRRINSVIVTFTLMTLSVAIFQISHVLGANATSPELSRKIFMFNLANIPIAVFMTHWFLALAGKVKERRRILAAIYASGIAMFFVYILFPDTFLRDSVPKLYFPYYYEPGPLQIIMRIWFNVVGIYYFYELIKAYRETGDPIKKNRYKYVFAAIVYGFIVGSSAILLVYDVPFDPMWSMFFGLYTIPLAYAIIKYELLDIRIFAKRAFLYALMVAVVGMLINAINFLGERVLLYNPAFPRWVFYLASSVLAVGIAFFTWSKSKEADILKYEFINVVTHKFRTPLTKIRWSLDAIARKTQNLDAATRDALEAVGKANMQLVELTNMLVTINDPEAGSHLYRFKETDVAALTASALQQFTAESKKERVELSADFPQERLAARLDPEKVAYVLQVLVGNSIAYGGKNPRTRVTVRRRGNHAVIDIADNGIGIPKPEQPYIFNQFYRGSNARRVDTEGNGVGLFVAKSIVSRNGGSIGFASEGENKGTTFTVSFPLVATGADA